MATGFHFPASPWYAIHGIREPGERAARFSFADKLMRLKLAFKLPQFLEAVIAERMGSC
jgi:hypothetical protein